MEEKERLKKKYLVKAAGGIPRAERSASGQDTKASGLLFTKTGRDHEHWQEAKTSIITHNHTSLNPSSTEAINQSTPPPL